MAVQVYWCVWGHTACLDCTVCGERFQVFATTAVLQSMERRVVDMHALLESEDICSLRTCIQLSCRRLTMCEICTINVIAKLLPTCPLVFGAILAYVQPWPSDQL